MFIDLKYPTRRKMPIGCEYVGGMRFKGVSMLLVRSIADGGQYLGVCEDGLIVALDQAETSEAVYLAQIALDAERAKTIAALGPPPASVTKEPKSMYSVSLTESAVATLRAYGNGNLSAGIRQAAKLLVGVC